jgi:CubicO group peptidase (beta-lactamase class C family)
MGPLALLVTPAAGLAGVASLLVRRRSNGGLTQGRLVARGILVGCALAATACEERTAADTTLARAIARIVTDYQGAGGAPGVSVGVARDGRVLFAGGFGEADVEGSVPASAETVYRIGSLTKQFTAHLILQLIDEGRLGLDDPIGRYLPELPAAAQGIPLWRLLNHTSGLASYPDSLQKRNQAMRIDWPADSVVHWIAAHPPDFAAGTRFQYSNGGYYLLGVIAERITRRPYAELLREKIFRPLGMSASSYCDERALVRHRAQGYSRLGGTVVRSEYLSMTHAFAAGAVCSNVLDLLRWQQALHTHQLISEAAYRRMATPVPPAGPPDRQYGFGLVIADLDGHQVIGHSGGINGFATFSVRVPSNGTDIVVLTNSEVGEPARIVRPLLALLDSTAVRTPE